VAEVSGRPDGGSDVVRVKSAAVRADTSGEKECVEDEEQSVATLLICDADPRGRERLARCAAEVPGVDRVDSAIDGHEVLSRYPVQQPDLVLVEARLPGPGGGAEVVRALVARHPEALVFVVGDPDDDRAMTALLAGARGVLRRGLAREELSVAIAHALAGDLVLPATRSIAVAPPVAAPSVVLTEREMQVLRGMSGGKTNSEIGRELYLSEDTVKTHARRLYRKLGVNDRAHAVASGFRLGLMS